MSGSVPTTPFLLLLKPPVGGARDAWGGYENSNMDLLDAWAVTVATDLANIEATLIAMSNAPGPTDVETIGTVKWWPGTEASIQASYRKCDGTVYLVSDYPTLAGVLGAGWGGDGVSTFGVPDMRGVVPVGRDAGTGRLAGQVPDAIGATGGSATVALTASQMAPHAHGGTTDTASAHTHSVGIFPNSMGGQPGYNSVVDPATGTGAIATGPAGAHAHGIATDTQGGGQAHGNVQPSVAGTWIIKALSG